MYQNSTYYQQRPGNNMLPPMQIITANGKQSINNLQMSPNSSVLIADESAPIIWKCTSDGLGNVTALPFDISPHKDEAQIEKETMNALLIDINNRLKRLEENYEQSSIARNETERSNVKSTGNQKNMGHAKNHEKSSGSLESGIGE